MMLKNDYFIAAAAGLLTAIFFLPVFINIGSFTTALAGSMIVLIPILWICGIWLGRFLSKWMGFFAQFSKFVVVGFLNASIDFGILNSLSFFTGAVSGLIIGGVNAPGFLAAAINSYFWNRLWVFPQKNDEGKLADFPKFFVISVLGVFLNSLIIIYITTYVPQFGFGDAAWLNVAKGIASAIVLVWNFVGYKFFAFK